MISFLRAANGHLANLDSWNADADRNALTFLAANSYAWIERQIVSNGSYMFKSLRTIATGLGTTMSKLLAGLR